MDTGTAAARDDAGNNRADSRTLPRSLERGAHRSIRSAIGEVIREDIMSGRLAPGARIPIKEISLAFGVAASVVREALLQLAADGLAVAEDQRGFRVAPISVDDLQDVCRARVDVESLAIRDAIAHGDEEWEAQVVAALHRLVQITNRRVDDTTIIHPVYAQQHRAFHAVLVSACRSKWMLRFHDTLMKHTERYRQLIVTMNNHREIDQEHRAMVAAILERDADRAVALISHHVNVSRDLLLQAGAAKPSVGLSGPTGT
jgi:DNA-binding GntR family transcriptional regulator